MRMIHRAEERVSSRTVRMGVVLVLTIAISAIIPHGWAVPMKAEAAVAVGRAWPATACGTGTGTVNCASLSIPAGSNRLMLVAVTDESAANWSSASVSATYGGRVLTQIINADNVPSTTTRAFLWVGYLKEADLAAAGSGQTLSVRITYGGTTPRDTAVFWAVYAGVDQTAPINSSAVVGSDTSASSCSFNLTSVNGGYNFIAGSNNGTTWNSVANYTQHWAYNLANHGSSGRSRQMTTGITNEAVSMGFTSSRYSCGGVSLRPASACTDPDPATLTITSPAGGSSVSGASMIQVQVGTETAPSTMTEMMVNIANAGACNVANGAMIWNGATNRWEYNWNTSACGTAAPVTGVTINAGGNDSDCGTPVNAAQVNNITINNVCSETATVAVTEPVPNPIIGPTAISATLGGSGGSNPQVSSDNVNWFASPWIYNPPAPNQTGTVTFYARATGACGTVSDPTPVATTYNTTSTADPSKLKNCASCHGYPPLDGARSGVTGAVVGDHQVHSYACSTCHVIPATETSTDFGHRNGQINMKVGSAAIDGGYYDKDNSGGYSAADATFPQTNNPTTRSCRTVACHGGLTTPQWGVGTATCSDCHGGVVKGVRRTITGASGDFAKASSHTTGTNLPGKATCQACHGNHLGLGVDSNASLLNADTGAAVTYTGTGASVETVCVSCHDANGAARLGTPTDPFGADGTNVVDIGWTVGTVAHSQAANANKCFGCHGNATAAGTTLDPLMNAHGSSQPKIMRYSYNSADSVTTATNVCYNCHGTPVANGAVNDIETLFGKAGKHSSVTCLGCHNVHQAKPGNHAAQTNTAGGVLNGASGAALTTNPGFWAAPAAGNFTAKAIASGSDFEAALCFKCHTAYNPAYNATSPSGGYAMTDLAREFNPNNVGNFAGSWASGETAGSFHPVLAAATNNLGRTNNIVAPWTTASLMTCSDCHASDSSTDPNGPHGSAANFILKGPNTIWNATIATTSTGMPAGTFCINCHNQNFTNSRFSQHASRSDHRVACSNCHVMIPHGSEHPGLLHSAAGRGSGVPAPTVVNSAPYMRAPTGNRLYIASYPANNTTGWGQNNCGCNGTGH